MLRKAAVGVGAGLGMMSGVYFGNAMANNFKHESDCCSDRFNVLAKVYDEKINPTEKSFGMMDMRRKLVNEHAVGRVLETCCGTGRNTEFYDMTKVTQLTLMDASEEMLVEARKKLTPTQLEITSLVCARSLSEFPSNSFDSIVDTFGICSVTNPQEFLLEVKRVLKPGGEAVFLEHGRNENGWLRFVINAWLDFRAPAHEAYWGCLWNREIVKLVSESGFTIKSQTVHHYGTCTQLVVEKKSGIYKSSSGLDRSG
ncbi:hypothetical protein BASA81_005440 [Batrachochytrium salamandrivorans]|nr:hypothetical protein BASA81_005440 [Batrachochytrium salamandrivorans]